MPSEVSTRRIAVRSVLGLGTISVLLFGGAGTMAWPEAWFLLLVQTAWSVIIVWWLGKHNPELLQERMDLWKRVVKPWDKVIVVLLMAFSAPLFVLPGLDAVRYQWSHVPLLLKIIGFAVFAFSYALIFWVMKTNPFSSAVVEIQEDRGHETITTGPYQYVRHPMYVGAILMFLTIPLALGSLIALIPGIILTVLIVIRTDLEDKTLHKELVGYAAYAETVKYRLIPGIW